MAHTFLLECHENNLLGEKWLTAPKEILKYSLLLMPKEMTIMEAFKESRVKFTKIKKYYHNTKHVESLTDQHLDTNYTLNKIFRTEKKNSGLLRLLCILVLRNEFKAMYEYSIRMCQENNIKIPQSWETNQMTSKDWSEILAFRRRHNLTLRRPQPCSLARLNHFH